jgi:hypothetical protein
MGGVVSAPVGVSGSCRSIDAGLLAGGASTADVSTDSFSIREVSRGAASVFVDGYFVGRCSGLRLRLLRPGLLIEEDENARSQDEHQDWGQNLPASWIEPAGGALMCLPGRQKPHTSNSSGGAPFPHRGDKPPRTHPLRA